MVDELRILHAADLHIDSPLRGLIAYDGAPTETIRNATRTAFLALVSEAINRKVHLVLIAGDLYDGEWRDYNTGLFVINQLALLHEAGIPVVIIHGNHDAQSNLTKRLRFPPNTKVLSHSHPETYILGEIGVAVHGQSYATRAVMEDLSLAYPVASDGFLNIGMLHTCFDGSLGHDPYAPCRLDGLRSKRYDYWALGHVHNRRILSDDPPIVFPGNLQGRHIRETGPKGATLVTFVDKEPRLEELTLATVRWERCQVDVTGVQTFDGCLERCHERLKEICETGAETYAVRIELSGITNANGSLRSDIDRLTNEIRALGLLTKRADVWIEKVQVSTTPARGKITAEGSILASEINGVLAELKNSVSDISNSGDRLLASLSDLRTQLRAAGISSRDDPLSEERLSESLDDAAELLMALLVSKEDQVAD